jgi:hypothetical protein
MPDDERYIRTGDERWTQQAHFDVRWKVSQKGNPYLKTDVNGVDVVLTVFQSQFKRTDEWTYSIRYAEQWIQSQRFFVDEESAKTAALEELGRMRRGGAERESEPAPPARPKREPVRDDSDPVRRIRL